MEKYYIGAINDALNIDGDEWIDCDDGNEPTHEWIPSRFTFKDNHKPWNKGKTGTCSEIQIEKARLNAIKRNENQKGANNRNAKTWRIVYEDGREITIGGLQRWAVNNGYSASGIKNIAYGKWKRYRDLVTVEEVV